MRTPEPANANPRTPAPTAPIPVIQDGARFYNDRTGDELFTSSVRVPDGDISAAFDAREEFTAYAERIGLRWYPA